MEQIYAYTYFILAKFMRISSANFVKEYEHKLMNTHHLFLQGCFYRQVHILAVKLISVTAHFVSNDLDEGPIIV